MSGRVENAEEAFSRAGMLAFEKYSQQEDKILNPHAWLFRLTYHVCIDLHRELRREGRWVVVDSEAVTASSIPIWSGQREVNPERGYLHHEKEEFLGGCIQELPLKLRSVMIPLLCQGRSYGEIADSLAISESTLRKRVQDARALMRQNLSTYLAGKLRKPVAKGLENTRPPKPEWDSWSRVSPVAVTKAQVLVDGRLEEVVLTFAETSRKSSHPSVGRLETYIEKHPTGWKKRMELGRLLRLSGHFERAEVQYRAVIERRPCELNAWIELAEILPALGRRSEMPEIYREALRAAPRPASRKHLEGLMARCEKRWRESIQALKEAAEIEPRNASHWMVLTEIYLEVGWSVEALSASDQALSLEPNNPLVLILNHDALLASGRPTRAGQQIARSLELDDSNPLSLLRFLAFHSRVRQANTAQSLLLLNRLEALVPQNADICRARARFYVAQGDWTAGERCLAEFVARFPSHAQGRLYHGELLRDIGRESEATERFLEAYQLEPQGPEICLAHARMLRRNGLVSAARSALVDILKLFPDHISLITAVAGEMTFLFPEEPDRLEEVLIRIESLQPESAESVVCRGRVMARLGRWQEAVDAYRRAWPLLPEDAASLDTSRTALDFADCWSRLGIPSRQRKWLQVVLDRTESLWPSLPARAWALRGWAFKELGRTSDSQTAFRKSLKQGLLYPYRAVIESQLGRSSTQEFNRPVGEGSLERNISSRLPPFHGIPKT